MHSGYRLQHAEVRNGRVHVRFAKQEDGSILQFEVDHVIAGTGYRVDLKRLPFLDDATRSRIRLEGSSPLLSRHFESSIPGLYFVGLASAVSFGPLTRFAYGAGYTARILTAYLRRNPARRTAEILCSSQS